MWDKIKGDAAEPLQQTHICQLARIFTPMSVNNYAKHPVYNGLNMDIQ